MAAKLTRTPGVTETGSILDRIIIDGHDRLAGRKQQLPEARLRELASRLGPPWPLSSAIRSPRGPAANAAVQIIAEVKKASPSRGVLAEHLDAVAVAKAYAGGGATAISVVTEPKYFLGELDWLLDIRTALDQDLPAERPSLLRKDFLFDPYQLQEARAFGADTVLLIVAMLDDSLLAELLAGAVELGLDALVEVHTQPEAERAVRAGASLFGINNRDLHTFKVDLATTERIRPLLPADAIVVAESGVHAKADVQHLTAAGVHAILVGEAFMTAPHVASKLAELRA
jgi:indole-3-glycerol phosphate synthase